MKAVFNSMGLPSLNPGRKHRRYYSFSCVTLKTVKQIEKQFLRYINVSMMLQASIS